MSSALLSAVTPEHVAEVIVKTGRAAMEAAGAGLVVPSGPGLLTALRSDGYAEEALKPFASFPDDGKRPVSRVLHGGQPLLVPDVVASGHRSRVGTRAMALFPVACQGRVLGVLAFAFAEARSFDAEDREFMTALADQCGQAYQRALLFTAERDARAAAEAAQLRATLLQNLTASLSQALTPALVAQVAVAHAAEAMRASNGTVALLSEAGDALEIVAVSGLSVSDIAASWQRIPLQVHAPITDCVRSGEVLWLERRAEAAARYPELVPMWDRLAIDAVGCLPLEAEGRKVGALALVFDQPRPLSDDEHGFLRAVGRHIALAIERARLYAEAERARAFLSAAVQHVPAGLAIVDHQGRELFQNDEARRLFGSGAAARGVDDWANFSGRRPDGSAYAPSEWPLARALLGGESVQGEEATVVTPSGRPAVVSMSAAPVPGQNGRPAGAVVSINDVTDLRRAQEAQRFLGEAGVLLSQSLDVGEILDRLAALSVPRLADWCIIHRLSPDGSIDVATIRHQDPQRTAHAKALAAQRPEARSGTSLESVARGGPAVLIADMTDAHYQAAARDPAHLAELRESGHRSAMLIPLRSRGATLGVLTFTSAESGRRYGPADLELAQDLARRASLAMENALLYQEAERNSRNLEAVVAASPLAMMLSELDGVVRAWNPAAERLYGLPAGQIVGRRLQEIFPQRAAAFDGYLERVGRGEIFDGLEGTRLRQDGTPFLARIWSTLVTTARGRQCLSIVADVTAEKAAEQERTELLARTEKALAEAREATRLKDDFLATLSHEMRTPLTAILGWTQLLLLREQAPQDLARGLETVARNARAQLQMVEDLLDVSRIAAGNLRLAFEEVDLAAVVRTGLDAVRPLAQARGVQLVERGLAEPRRLAGDAARLQQVAQNLLVNAVKFTPEGGRVDVELRAAGEALVLAVRDTGCGIEPAFMPHLFGRFRQADSALTRKNGGLGLGLAIAQHLAALHGGKVEAHSEGPGKGALFELRLPLRRAPQPAPRAQPGEAPSAAGLRVLVVEDDADARELVGLMLEQFGATVQTAKSGAEAFELLEARDFDVLLSDVSMPGEDGYSFLGRVRKDSRQRGIPAGALTANARREDRARALEAGFQQHVPKPVEPDELVRIVGMLAGRDPSASR